MLLSGGSSLTLLDVPVAGQDTHPLGYYLTNIYARDLKPDEVREWMKEREFDYAVLLDDGYADRAGIRGYPTTWFIDRQGRIGFSKLGWSEALTEEFGWRVEALRGPEGG